MSLNNAYCSLAQLQAEIKNNDATLDSQFENAINQASRVVDRWTGRDWFMHDYSLTPFKLRKGDGVIDGAKLWLPYTPVIELTEVKYFETVLEPNVDYVLHGDALLNTNGETWLLGYGDDECLELTGIFGYDQTPVGQELPSTVIPAGIPEHIVKGTLMVAAAFSGKDVREIVSEDGIRDTIISKSIPKDLDKVLGPQAGRVRA